MGGAYALMRKDGYRGAMEGNISLYDAEGKRQHTIYSGEAPEYGKGTFFSDWKKKVTIQRIYFINISILQILLAKPEIITH